MRDVAEGSEKHEDKRDDKIARHTLNFVKRPFKEYI